MNLSKLYARTKKAVEQYNMIQKGDKIAVGISGGKDSLTLLYALYGLSKFKDSDFTIYPVMVDMGFEGFNPSHIDAFCKDLGLQFVHIKTELGKVIFEKRKEKNPCSMCSKMRKGIFNKTIAQLGCNKLAYGHHRDDFLDTFLLSLLYEGRFHTMEPKYYMPNANLTLIRPLLYVPEEDILKFSKDMNLPIVKNPCPADKNSARKEMGELFEQLKKPFPDCKEKLFHALKGVDFFNDFNDLI